MAFSTKAVSGVLLFVIQKRIARTVIQKLKITLHVVGGAGLDLTNISKGVLETKAQAIFFVAERPL
jgi:hypothetical protein